MEYVNKLPFILSTLMTIIIGFISFNGYDNIRDTYIKMTVSIVVFYVIGRLIRNAILEIEKDIKEKNQERGDMSNINNTDNVVGGAETLDSEEKENVVEQELQPHKIDYKVED